MSAILYLLVFLCGGGAIITLMLPRKRPIVRLWLGASLGMLLMMVLPALCASLRSLRRRGFCLRWF